MLKKISILILICALICEGACATEWRTTQESSENVRLLYRIPVDAPQPEAIPDDLNAESETDALKVHFEGALYDFGRGEGRNCLASPAKFDPESLLRFFFQESEILGALKSVETVSLPDGNSAAQYVCQGATVQILPEAGRVCYARDGLGWAGADAFSGDALDPFEFVGLPGTEALFADYARALSDAQALLDRADVGASAMIVDAYGAVEWLETHSRSVEIYSFALAWDGVPLFNHAQQLPASETMLPAQELKLIYDADGLAEASLTAFRFQADGEAPQSFDLSAAAERLRTGEGAFVFSSDLTISLIALQYVPVEARDGGWLCAPAWRMSTQNDAPVSSWFAENVNAAYLAFDGAPIS